MTGTFHPITSESLISRGRNGASAHFLNSDCDYMLFVDTDMSFTVKDFNELAKVKKPLTIGAYCKKYIQQRKRESYSKIKNNKFESDWKDYVTDFSTEVPAKYWSGTDEIPKHITVNYGATGFMLIHKSVFETIIQKRPELKYINDIDFKWVTGEVVRFVFPNRFILGASLIRFYGDTLDSLGDGTNYAGQYVSGLSHETHCTTTENAKNAHMI